MKRESTHRAQTSAKNINRVVASIFGWGGEGGGFSPEAYLLPFLLPFLPVLRPSLAIVLFEIFCTLTHGHTEVTRSSATAKKQGVRNAFLCSCYFLSYTDVYHLRNLRPTIRLIYYATANKLQHATAVRARDARPHCRLMSTF